MSFQWFAQQGLDQVTRELKTNARGLKSAQAQERVNRYGWNELESHKLNGWLILWRQIASPFVLLLGGATVISMTLGQIQEGALILLFILINTVLGFWQEFQSSKALELLKRYIQPSCHVLRDGKFKSLACREIVPGDVIELEAGDIVPADARVIETTNCIVDESTLTGESQPVPKSTIAIKKSSIAIHQAKNLLFSASKIVEGKAKAVVFATGQASMVGEVATLTDANQRPSQFERGISRFSGYILRLVGITLVLIFLANILIKGGNANPIELLLFSVALAVSVIPEALPLVMTISLSRGALRLAKKNVVIKRLSSIEDLGGITVLCTDKTGTITENNLSVVETYGDDPHTLLVSAAAANGLHASKTKGVNNAFDLAINNVLDKHQRVDLSARSGIRELPFDPVRRRNTVLVKHGKTFELISRGAPEQLLTRCKHLSTQDKRRFFTWMEEQGEQGRRVIAVAKRELEEEVDDLLKNEQDLTFLGAIAFFDPLKSSAKHAIQKAKDFGIQVKILTGDSLDVAIAVGKQIGLIKTDAEAMSGEEFEALKHEARLEALKTHSIFARVSPEQKYHVIQALQQSHTVGFLGEGINDAPALKSADVGLAVQGASDVARDAADVILLNKSLDVIINGIIEGREVFTNTVKYIRITLTSNFGNFYSVAIASLFIDFLPMLPIQILLVNLLSDFPMIAISTDRIDPEETKKPRRYDVKDIILFATALGIVSTVFDFIYFALFFRSGPATLQTNWFIGSILTELFIIYSIRTKRFFLLGKPVSWTVLLLTGAAAIITVILPLTELGRRLFQFQSPTPTQLGITISIAVIYFTVSECVKLAFVKLHKKQSAASS